MSPPLFIAFLHDIPCRIIRAWCSRIWYVYAFFLSCACFAFICSLEAHCATAIAANGSFRYLLGAVFPLFTIQMYEKLGVHWAGSVFAFLSLGLLPIPWILFKFGHQLRKNSRFITSSQVED